MSPNDYELGYDEGYQDGADMIHLKKQLAEIDKLARHWKARAEKAEAALRNVELADDVEGAHQIARLCTKAEWEAKYGDKR